MRSVISSVAFLLKCNVFFFFFSSRRRHTRFDCDWSSDVCSSDLFGGFGKEYAVDMTAQIATEHGIVSALVDFGHDLRAIGAPPGRPAWHIGLEDPKAPGTAAGSLAIVGKGVASSGDYIRGFVLEGKRYGHIIDSRTGRPVANGCIQSTVIAANCLQAGVLSTTAFVLGATRGIEFIQQCPGAEGLLVMDRARAQTRGFFNYVAA